MPTENFNGSDASLAHERIEIEKTLQRYIRGLDDMNVEEYLSTLTDDFCFYSAEGNYEGKEAVTDFIRSFEDMMKRKKAEGDPLLRKRHMVTNLVFETLTSSKAVTQSYWILVLDKQDQGIKVAALGSSQDTLVKKDGTWFMQERKVFA